MNRQDNNNKLLLATEELSVSREILKANIITDKSATTQIETIMRTNEAREI